jgi:hypothetical protein
MYLKRTTRYAERVTGNHALPAPEPPAFEDDGAVSCGLTRLKRERCWNTPHGTIHRLSINFWHAIANRSGE